jgi:hypothetical protein
LPKNEGRGTTVKVGNSIPDSVGNGRISEVKSSKYVYRNTQMRDYLDSNKPVDYYINKNTKVSKPAQKAIKKTNGRIYRRLGPNNYQILK